MRRVTLCRSVAAGFAASMAIVCGADSATILTATQPTIPQPSQPPLTRPDAEAIVQAMARGRREGIPAPDAAEALATLSSPDPSAREAADTALTGFAVELAGAEHGRLVDPQRVDHNFALRQTYDASKDFAAARQAGRVAAWTQALTPADPTLRQPGRSQGEIRGDHRRGRVAGRSGRQGAEARVRRSTDTDPAPTAQRRRLRRWACADATTRRRTASLVRRLAGRCVARLPGEPRPEGRRRAHAADHRRAQCFRRRPPGLHRREPGAGALVAARAAGGPHRGRHRRAARDPDRSGRARAHHARHRRPADQTYADLRLAGGRCGVQPALDRAAGHRGEGTLSQATALTGLLRPQRFLRVGRTADPAGGAEVVAWVRQVRHSGRLRRLPPRHARSHPLRARQALAEPRLHADRRIRATSRPRCSGRKGGTARRSTPPLPQARPARCA